MDVLNSIVISRGGHVLSVSSALPQAGLVWNICHLLWAGWKPEAFFGQAAALPEPTPSGACAPGVLVL